MKRLSLCVHIHSQRLIARPQKKRCPTVAKSTVRRAFSGLVFPHAFHLSPSEQSRREPTAKQTEPFPETRSELLHL